MSTKLDEELLHDLSTFLGDDLQSVIDIFLSHSSDLILKIAEACKTKDNQQTAILLHSFKGGAKNIGALTLAEHCAELEDRAKQGMFELIQERLPILENEVEELKIILPRFVSS